MSRYFGGRIIIFNESETKYETLCKINGFWFKDIVDDDLMDEFKNNNEKWDKIIPKLYDINLNSENEDEKRINKNLINNAYILDMNALKRLIEIYEEKEEKKNEEIDLLKETIVNQQSINSYNDMLCELKSLNEDLIEIKDKLFSIENIKGLFMTLSCCYENNQLKKAFECINPYLIIVVE